MDKNQEKALKQIQKLIPDLTLQEIQELIEEEHKETMAIAKRYPHQH